MNRIKHDRPLLFVLAILLAGCLMSFSAFASLGTQDPEPQPDTSESADAEGEDTENPEETPDPVDDNDDQGEDDGQEDDGGELSLGEETPALPSSVTSGGSSSSLPTTGRTLQSMIGFGLTGAVLLAAGVLVLRKRNDD